MPHAAGSSQADTELLRRDVVKWAEAVKRSGAIAEPGRPAAAPARPSRTQWCQGGQTAGASCPPAARATERPKRPWTKPGHRSAARGQDAHPGTAPPARRQRCWPRAYAQDPPGPGHRARPGPAPGTRCGMRFSGMSGHRRQARQRTADPRTGLNCRNAAEAARFRSSCLERGRSGDCLIFETVHPKRLLRRTRSPCRVRCVSSTSSNGGFRPEPHGSGLFFSRAEFLVPAGTRSVLPGCGACAHRFDSRGARSPSVRRDRPTTVTLG